MFLYIFVVLVGGGDGRGGGGGENGFYKINLFMRISWEKFLLIEIICKYEYLFK